MRNLLLCTGLSLLASACNSAPGQLADPPILKVTSPARSLIQSGAGTVTVTGTVTPNAEGTPVSKVSVNDVVANVAADGSFSIDVDVPPGATFLHTVALDQAGGQATDTRSVEAGDLRAPGANIANAVTAALSAEAFAKVATAAGPLIKGLDLKPMLAPLQPMVHSGDENGPDCLYGQLFIDNVTMTNAIITMVPVQGGLQFSAEIDGLDVPGHLSYKVACLGGTDNTDISADTGHRQRHAASSRPNGMNGFTTTLQNPDVQLTGLNITSGGVPGDILDILQAPSTARFEYIMPKVAGMFMTPMMNKALGALGGPQTLNVLGKTLTVQVSPSAITFTPAGGLVTLDMSMLIDGAQGSKGYVYTDNGMPSMDPGQGIQLGIADDLANEMLSQFVAIGMLNLSMPANAGTFDNTAVAMTSPPMISADPSDGKMRLYLPDMTATFSLLGTPVGKAAINVKLDIQAVPANGGFGVGLQLNGTPDINVDVLNDIANETKFSNDDLSKAITLCLDNQIVSLSALLAGIPLPSMAGLTMKDLSVGEADYDGYGYTWWKGGLQVSSTGHGSQEISHEEDQTRCPQGAAFGVSGEAEEAGEGEDGGASEAGAPEGDHAGCDREGGGSTR